MSSGSSPGVTDVASGESTLAETARMWAVSENASLPVVPSGEPIADVSMLGGINVSDALESIADRADFVLIDAPPVLPVSDPASIASIVDGVYMVTRIRKGVKLTAQKAKETLDAVGANWIGIIVNGLDENPHYSEYGYQYGNYSYYGGLFGKYYDSNNKAYREKISVSSDA